MGDDHELTGPDFSQGVELAALRDGEPLLGQMDGQAAMLVRRGEALHAVAATCSHYSGPLAEGLVVGETVRCPWHHACFSLRTGAVLGPPGLSPLACWAVEVLGGKAYARDRRQPEPAAKPPRSPASVAIVGAGAAGEAAASGLREFGYAGPVTLLGAEASAPLDRPNLSKDYLAGHAPDDWLPLRPEDYWREHGITLLTGRRVIALETAAHRLHCADGRSLNYGALLLATGALPVQPALPGADRAHVHTLRTLADVRAILAGIDAGARRAVVVGASFIGLEAAASLRARGVEVHVVAPEAQPLARVFGPRLADHVRRVHDAMGTVFHLGRKPAAIHTASVELDDGTQVGADLVVFGIGVRPDVTLAQQAGLQVDNGIVVDAFLATSAPDVYAAGDVANWPDAAGGGRLRIEHWAVAQAQGRQAARNILGYAEPFRSMPFFWSQHGDVALNYVGHAQQWDRVEEEGDPATGSYLCRYFQGGRLLAVASLGRDLDSLRAEAAMQVEMQVEARTI
ncbi:MAG: FAD-dependent oxidoreductase [Burkholderiales bacterium]|nr:FAD-dependent oxidoreductase [Burkholderiales bacterium]